MTHLPWLLAAYWRTRRLHFASRATLQAHQARALRNLGAYLVRRSPWFAGLDPMDPAGWPTMDKPTMLAHFDHMNTAGLHLDEVLQTALRAERSRDFRPQLLGHTVGLSSGTTGQRGVFVVSARERAEWAGVMLARMLPRGLMRPARVALFLRAHSRLYDTVRTPWLGLRFFDLFAPWPELTDSLQRYQPQLLVAPAQVLRRLALARLHEGLALRPQRVISAAEVLRPQDRILIEQAFGEVHEVYQATEGFLASTCERGTLHLHEEHLWFETEWLDDQQQRFVPRVTDFRRRIQPIVRYRLDDVLVVGPPCACGRVTRTLARIEGRCDDQFDLPGRDGQRVSIFADVLQRALAQVLPLHADHQLDQTGPAALVLQADTDSRTLARAQVHLVRVLHALGVATGELAWVANETPPAWNATAKRRHIRRLWRPGTQA
jgi:putative adenylate-forming enzyme